MQDPRYQLVRSEIQRGIFEATGLETQASPSYGWLGVQCESEAMAGWMVLAVVAENVMARREGGVLYVPLGREFRVRKEVKNVIAAIAKTFYYWQQYRRDRHFGE